MSRYIVARLGQGVIALFFLVTLVFVLARLIGNPVDMMLPSDATPADREAMIRKLGLDRPYYVQYAEFMGGVLKGDVGESFSLGKPVMELFLSRFPNTIRLATVAMTIAMVFGFALGVASGTHRGSPIDHLCRAVSVIGMSAPAFWVGLMLMLIFAVRLDLLPVARMEGPESYILPGITLSFVTLAGTARLIRSSMIDALDSEYVKLARIKGVSPNVVVWKHCLRNALLPVVTFAGVHLAGLLNGSVVIESVFAWPGVGRLIYQGILGRDYPLVQGCLLIVGFMIIAINLAVDILYSYIDPRIRVAGGKE
jgi:peptide/nickel transport system permease protein